MRTLAPALLAGLLLATALPAHAQTQVALSPPRLWLATGDRATVDVRVTPSSALAGLALAAPSQLEARLVGSRLTVIARAPGQWTVELRQGPGGAVLARLPVAVQAPLLERVLDRVRAEAGHAPIVVFDLDDTLFDTRWRTLKVLQAWGQSHGEPRLVALELEDVRWDLAPTLRNAGLSSWEIAGPLGRAIAAERSRHFSDYPLDRPFPGAVEYVRAVQAAGARVAYVTGRTEPKRALSEQVLRQWGFPVEGALRWFKPLSWSGSTASYKGRVVRQSLPGYGQVVACFDNEPANCNAFETAAPGAIQVFLDTLYPSDSPALLSGVETIEAWR